MIIQQQSHCHFGHALFALGLFSAREMMSSIDSSKKNITFSAPPYLDGFWPHDVYHEQSQFIEK